MKSSPHLVILCCPWFWGLKNLQPFDLQAAAVAPKVAPAKNLPAPQSQKEKKLAKKAPFFPPQKWGDFTEFPPDLTMGIRWFGDSARSSEKNTKTGWWWLEHDRIIFPNSWDDDVIWRTPSFFRRVAQPPTRKKPPWKIHQLIKVVQEFKTTGFCRRVFAAVAASLFVRFHEDIYSDYSVYNIPFGKLT